MSASEVLRRGEVEGETRTPDTILADIQVMRRHLRRKLSVSWDEEIDGIFYGQVNIDGTVWTCDLTYRAKYNQYRFRVYKPMEYQPQIEERYDAAGHDRYALCKTAIVTVMNLRMISAAGLKYSQD